jgi:hypothetical protein
VEERRDSWNKRQIDEMDRKLDSILKIMNGNGETGMNAKVNIMWGYRYLFISAIVANVVGMIFFMVKGG